MNLKFEKIIFSLLFLLSCSFMEAQTIQPTNLPGTNSYNQVPTGWAIVSGTPDRSNQTNASINTTNNTGGGAAWVQTPGTTGTIITLPTPLNGHTSWLSLRDLSTLTGVEAASVPLTSLFAGRTYNVYFYTLSGTTNQTGFNGSAYAGKYIDNFTVAVDGIVSQTKTTTNNTWQTQVTSFVATTASHTMTFGSGTGAGVTANSPAQFQNAETVQISVSSNAINTVPLAVADAATTAPGIPVAINAIANDLGYDAGQTLTVDLDPSTPAVNSTLTVANQGTWTVNSSGVVTFTPLSTFTGTATLPYTVRDNYTLDGVLLPGISNTANISVNVSLAFLDSDGDGILDSVDLDDDNDGILDTVECGFSCGKSFANGSFELPVQGAGVTMVSQSTAGVEWQTTATDGIIEYWRDANAAQGSQYVELNANQESTLYQSFCLNGNGGTINWSVKHRGRSGVDVAAVKFGTTIAAAQAAASTQTMSDGNTAWGTYSGVYTIPAGATSLVIAFQSISAAGGNITIGNFIDDVQVVVNQNCLDSDGDGIPNNLDLDSDNDGCPDVIEGAANFQNGASYITANRLNTTVNGNGVPAVPAGTTGYTQTGGQAIGTSQNAAANECYIDAKNDITETPRNIPVTGSVLTNDIAIGIAMSTTVLPTYLNSSGTATSFAYGTPSNVYSATGVLAGSMIFNSNGTYTFTPTATFIGTVPVNYTAVNGAGFTDSAVLEIKVVPNVNTYFNNPPIALNDNGITKINTNLASTVLGNDSDPDGNAITVNAVNGVAANVGAGVAVSGVNSAGTAVANAGTLTLNAAGTYTFVPTNNFTGTVNPVTYTITDGNGGTSSATLNIDVQAAVTPPVVFAGDDAKATPKGVSASGNILSNDTKTSGGTLTVTGATVNGATFTVNGTAQTISGVGTVSINPTTGAYTFTPLANYVGTTPVVYQTCDGLGGCSTATLYLTSLDSGFMDAKNDINQTPVNVPVSGGILANDASSTTATVTSASQGGTAITLGGPAVQVSGVNAAGTTVANAGTLALNSAGAYTFTPASGFVGTVTIDYVATNTIGNTDPASLQIKVLPAVNSGGNNPPVALNDTGVTKIGITLNSNVLGNDSDPDVGNVITVTGATQGGTVIGNTGTPVNVTGVNALGATVTAGTFALTGTGTGAGNYTFIPAAGFAGTVNPISYTISDGNGGTSTANVNIEVRPIATPPTVFANDDAKATLKGVPASGTVITNDTNSAGGAVTATQAIIEGVTYNLTAVPTVVVVPNVGTVTISANGNYTFAPLPTYVGTYAVPYRISNAALTASSSAVLYLTSLDGQTYCYRTPATPTSTTLQPVKHGITALSRAGTASPEWPTVRQGAWTVLEAKTKGFVVNRMEFAGGNPVGIPVANFIEGMMVYDTVANCLKVYTSTDGGITFAWYCMGTQTCPN